MTPHYADEWLTVYAGDCREVLRELPDESVHCVVTSPPYWGLRDYGVAGMIGLEPSPEEWVAEMVGVFRELRRVLRTDGCVWLNVGDAYAAANGSGPQGMTGERASRTFTASTIPKMAPGLKPKDLIGLPWLLAFALRADGWWLRADIVWAKANPMPESVTDRPTRSHEFVFLLTKASRYFYDADAVREPHSENTHPYAVGGSYDRPGERWQRDDVTGSQGMRGQDRATYRNPAGRNLRDVWQIASEPYPGAHFATYPQKLVEPCIKAGCPVGGTVLDPFAGSGTTALVANRLSRRAILIDLNTDYIDQAMKRNHQVPLGVA